MLPSPSFWQSESSMQPVRTPPAVSALLLLPEAADVTAITARHASRFDINRSMTTTNDESTAFEIGDQLGPVVVTGLVTRLRSERDLEKYHSHTHMSSLKTPPWRRGRKPRSCCHGSSKAGRAAFVAFGWRSRLAAETKTRVKTSLGYVGSLSPFIHGLQKQSSLTSLAVISLLRNQYAKNHAT